MRDLTKCGAIAAPRGLPKGIAFEIADLALIQAWADFHDLRVQIRLDHGAPATDYEEVIALYIGTGNVFRALIWRNAKAVFVQRLIGRRQRYGSVAAAMESLVPRPLVAVTDITPAAWPSR